MEPEEIAEQARRSISDFCINECHAYCCRKGFLVMTPEETVLVTHKHKAELLRRKVLNEMKDGRFSMDFTNHLGGCPRLKNFKCTIHDDAGRPDTCKKYPIFLKDKTIRLSPRCPAVQQNKLYPYVRQLISMGFKIKEF